MALDALAKRFFPGVVLVLIAVAAYLQASGVMQLVAGTYFDNGSAADDKARSDGESHGDRHSRRRARRRRSRSCRGTRSIP